MISFKAFPQFNSLRTIVHSKSRLSRSTMRHFPTDRLPDQIARALTGVLTLKELVESFEFFERVRKRLRRPTVTDLMAGHGLVGALFAVFEKTVNQVILLDREQPPSHEAILKAIQNVAPWAPPKLTYRTEKLHDIQPGSSLLAVHACGQRTDACLQLAIQNQAPIAAMPCCYGPPKEASRALVDSLGAELATDIARTYRLEKHGFTVKWSAIPPEITPMNRILIAY